MKVSGSHVLPVPQEEAYAALQNPDMLARCIPGSEELVQVEPGVFQMKMKMLIASISGAFEGKVRIADPDPPKSFRLIVEGAGRIGFTKGEGLLTLGPAAEGTEVRYDGDVTVGGTIASVGQRLIDTTSKMMIKRFFEKLAKELKQAA